MSDVRSAFPVVPRVGRWAAVGAAVTGTLGAVVGLLVGLRAYPPTAGFAVLELGVPGAIVGGLLGAAAAVLRVSMPLRDRRPR